MEEKIKHIVAQYTKIPAEQLTEQTLIDRSAVASSIILHRMYAQLAAEGIVVENYSDISTYGQLQAAVNDTGNTAVAGNGVPVAVTVPAPAAEHTAVGIDIEQVDLMPVTNDFRSHDFYTMNFSPSEIAFCILQPQPYASFAGLFAAKEAIVKAENAFRQKPFHTINIDHLPGGKPVFPGFEISISHTGQLAVAVAVKLHTIGPSSFASPLPPSSPPFTLSTLLSVTALLIASAALLIILLKSC